ncbi:hypothetical protein TNCV_4233821 [Trichonephila clavipes]|nr:hypothetical protein TNCV_4233821 [Trichonephila clavipes]
MKKRIFSPGKRVVYLKKPVQRWAEWREKVTCLTKKRRWKKFRHLNNIDIQITRIAHTHPPRSAGIQERKKNRENLHRDKVIQDDTSRGRGNFEGIEVKVGITFQDGDRFNSCQVIYSQFGLAIHQNDHQARRRFVEWAQNEIAVVPDFHKRILFSDEVHFWLNGYVNKQNCRIWREANPQVYVETPLHPEKLTVWCALWAGGILLQKR